MVVINAVLDIIITNKGYLLNIDKFFKDLVF